MPTPTAETQAAFRAFLASRGDLDAETEFAEFLRGGWVQREMVWMRRADAPRKFGR